ncbi:MAG: hypothetical protein ACE5OP_11390 [Candidatus Glassbacteria bacterium]
MKLPGISLVSMAILLIWGICQADTIHVPDDYATIQAGIDAATGGDTVLVSDGTYSGDGNRDIDFTGKAIVVKSENGPVFTLIDCGGNTDDPHRGFYFHSGEDSSSIVQGFTITTGWTTLGGGIYCRGSSPTISDNSIIMNTAGGYTYGYGGAIYCYESSPHVSGNLIMGNTASGNGGGIYSWNSSLTTDGNTIFGNTAEFLGGGIYCINDTATTVTNSILWENSAGTGQQIFLDSGASIDVNYCDVDGGWPGEGNIVADPGFVLQEKLDFRLLWDSPCIDAGQPTSSDPDGTIRDMGAYFFDQDDYLTLYLTPDSRMVQRGGQLGVTYTVINRWSLQVSFWILSRVFAEWGLALDVLGPLECTMPASYTVQAHIAHSIPQVAPLGNYEYRSWIGTPPTVLYDSDRFLFWVVEQ